MPALLRALHMSVHLSPDPKIRGKSRLCRNFGPCSKVGMVRDRAACAALGTVSARPCSSFQRWNFKATPLHCKSDSATLCFSAWYYFGTESALRQVRMPQELSRNGGCSPSTAISGFAQSLAPNKLSRYCDSQQLTCASNVDLFLRPLPETAFDVIR